jgi:hypothetical protein
LRRPTVLTDTVLYSVSLVDIADTARRVYGERTAEIFNRPLPKHDYRFHVEFSGSGCVTFGRDDTATDVAVWLEREGYIRAEAEQARAEARSVPARPLGEVEHDGNVEERLDRG